MEESTVYGSRTDGESMPGLETSWRSLEVGGILIVLLGLLAVVFPLVAGVSISLVLGGLLVVGGLVHVAHAFRARGWAGFAGQVLLAVVYVFAGISLLANPLLGLTTLTLLLIAYLLISGLVEVGVGLRLRGQPRWTLLLASGLLSVALGVILIAGFPSTAAWVVGLYVGINLIATGVSMVLMGRQVQREVTAVGGASGGVAQ
ncbi:Uncharacterized membrane protein HdeD, DUF308 family [Halomicrobium zhouii]|uniref:Uncharacterized membrane protein HdeD, DUF308 family n=1 Tax=Halomicrobium zhouii TaxID=767519 RepID=A0A1I6LAL5_9EURY|nr:DUF308 domain-containing protein [Halomicrobium zhouii]SFS00454.1 Uncharacterized membrane protein HdeD, DUF308 family [Halomicrobium zhouii]